MMFVLKVGPDRLTVTATMTAELNPAAAVTSGMTFTADYVVSRDGGTMHGLITSADFVIEGDMPDAGDMSGFADGVKQLQALADQPFAVGFRVQDGELIVRTVRVAGLTDEVREPFEMMAGRYKSTGDKPVPKPKPVKPPTTGGALPPAPQPVPCQLPPADLTTFPPQPLPAPPVMLTPGQYPVAGPVAMTGAALPAPPTPLPPPPAPSGPKLAGTWVRELDGVQAVLKFTDKRMFATVHVAFDEEGKKGETRFTYHADADYAVGPDGTVFGVITGLDFTPVQVDDADRDAIPPAKSLHELSGMPFCFRLRIDDGVMTVRDLRLADSKDAPELAPALGRYKAAGTKDPAPPKPGKRGRMFGDGARYSASLGAGVGAATAAAIGGMTLPSGRYLEHPPQYFPPDPSVPLQQELNTLEPAPAPRSVRPREEAPMPRPAAAATRPGFSARPFGLFVKPADPNARMEKLINQSFDSGPGPTRRKWFQFRDTPSNMTPERIHGGIM
jgi:hypothetical protein